MEEYNNPHPERYNQELWDWSCPNTHIICPDCIYREECNNGGIKADISIFIDKLEIVE